MDIFLVILWTIAGILTLCCKQVSKLSYAVTWIVLMSFLIMEAMGV